MVSSSACSCAVALCCAAGCTGWGWNDVLPYFRRSEGNQRYNGPLSIEWEDGRMDRFHGATESCAFVKGLDFPRNQIAFDAAFDKSNQ